MLYEIVGPNQCISCKHLLFFFSLVLRCSFVVPVSEGNEEVKWSSQRNACATSKQATFITSEGTPWSSLGGI